MEIKKICVVGGGVMGRQIALNAAIKGFTAAVYEFKPEVRENIKQWLETYMDGRIKKGRLTEEQVAASKARFSVTGELAEGVRGAQIVIEAVPEVEEIKRKVLKEISDLAEEGTIIATNSSYMVSSKFVDCVKDPSRLANMHFYNPALVMKFVEVVQGPHTSDETAQTLFDFAKANGKEPILMKKEIAGFAANYIIAGIYERAHFLVSHGYCSYQDVAKACEFGLGHPMGPYELDDLSGIDVRYNVLKRRYEETGVKSEGFDMIEKLYKEGRYGKKTGHGFYDYV